VLEATRFNSASTRYRIAAREEGGSVAELVREDDFVSRRYASGTTLH